MSSIEIADGQPLTYDWFANIVERIKSLEKDNNGIEDRQIIQVTGMGFANKKITIDCGQEEVERGTKRKNIIKQKINFTKSFAGIPLVTVSLSDAEGTEDKLGDPPYVILTIQTVTKNSATIKIRFINTTTENSPLKVNYIAIGETGSTN